MNLPTKDSVCELFGISRFDVEGFVDVSVRTTGSEKGRKKSTTAYCGISYDETTGEVIVEMLTDTKEGQEYKLVRKCARSWPWQPREFEFFCEKTAKKKYLSFIRTI
ncbi:MAG: hypothetical protein H6782_04055 [Candidatus Nomurabacteria bacterium]|nr:MAG: hypothetical protein H6782_04055 [Candidatus Nomurabacteria bacterium]